MSALCICKKVPPKHTKVPLMGVPNLYTNTPQGPHLIKKWFAAICCFSALQSLRVAINTVFSILFWKVVLGTKTPQVHSIAKNLFNTRQTHDTFGKFVRNITSSMKIRFLTLIYVFITVRWSRNWSGLRWHIHPHPTGPLFGPTVKILFKLH